MVVVHVQLRVPPLPLPTPWHVVCQLNELTVDKSNYGLPGLTLITAMNPDIRYTKLEFGAGVRVTKCGVCLLTWERKFAHR